MPPILQKPACMFGSSSLNDYSSTTRSSKYDLEEIENSGLFDSDFYLSQAPEAAKHAQGPAAHFLEIGSDAGLAPHLLFDSAYYLACNPDVAGAINPLLHFVLYGATSGTSPHPLFDAAFYLSAHQEVAKSGINPLLHYMRIGALEGLDPHPLFDTSYYIDQKPAGLRGNDNPLCYFLQHWQNDLVSCHPLFDLSYYISMNNEIRESGANPLIHYVMVGAQNGRDPHPLFDTAFYLQQKPEGLGLGHNPLAHFLRPGIYESADPHPLFDMSFYLDMNPNVKDHGMNPLCHYLRHGAAEKADPSPFFETAYYLETYPAARHVEVNPLTHYLSTGAKLGYNPSVLFDTRYYLDSYLSSAVEPDLEVNPLVHYARSGQCKTRITRRSEPEFALHDDGSNVDALSADVESSYAKLFKAIAKPCKHLFLLGCLMRGGAERSACHAIQLAADRAGGVENILVVITDVSSITCADWLPAGTRIVNLAALHTKLAQYDRGALIMRLMVATGAETIHLFNSPRAYAAVAHYFDCFQPPSAKILAYLCGYELYTDYNFSGFEDGALYRAAPYLDLLITDNNRLREAINHRYKHIPDIESKAVTCYQPLKTALHKDLGKALNHHVVKKSSKGLSREVEQHEQAKVIWASRLDATKRPDILAKIAQALPDVNFEAYGYSSSGYDFSYLRKLKNIKLMGEYADFSEIPKNDKAVFLYTSEADGMPNVLLEAVGSGFPIIAPDVGGIRELITDNSGWLVRKFDDVEQYVTILKYVLAHPEEAKYRSGRALSLLKDRHSWSAFSSRLISLGVF